MKYSTSDQEILKLFPYPVFRKGQKEIITTEIGRAHV